METITVVLKDDERLRELRRRVFENQGRLSAVRMLSGAKGPDDGWMERLYGEIVGAECEAELLRQEIFRENRPAGRAVRRFAVDLSNDCLVMWTDSPTPEDGDGEASKASRRRVAACAQGGCADRASEINGVPAETQRSGFSGASEASRRRVAACAQGGCADRASEINGVPAETQRSGFSGAQE